MSKAFTRENDDADEPEAQLPAKSAYKNYMTPSGFNALKSELLHLRHDERPKVVEIVAWAAGNGDRSENGDYIYGKKRLREIDRRIRYITRQLESAEVVDPSRQQGLKKVFFGATVTYVREDENKVTVTIVGVDEADLSNGRISWISPVAKALMKAEIGDMVELKTPAGIETIEVEMISYS